MPSGNSLKVPPPARDGMGRQGGRVNIDNMVRQQPQKPAVKKNDIPSEDYLQRPGPRDDEIMKTLRARMPVIGQKQSQGSAVKKNDMSSGKYLERPGLRDDEIMKTLLARMPVIGQKQSQGPEGNNDFDQEARARNHLGERALGAVEQKSRIVPQDSTRRGQERASNGGQGQFQRRVS